jgi:hypothetical protein
MPAIDFATLPPPERPTLRVVGGDDQRAQRLPVVVPPGAQPGDVLWVPMPASLIACDGCERVDRAGLRLRR